MVFCKKSYQHSAPKNIVINCINAFLKVFFRTLSKIAQWEIQQTQDDTD